MRRLCAAIHLYSSQYGMIFVGKFRLPCTVGQFAFKIRKVTEKKRVSLR